MSKNFKAVALLAGGVAGAFIGHHYKPGTPDTIVLGALSGALVVYFILGLVDG